MRSADECVAAPPLCAFLAAVKCAHHADTMTKLGFGCINTFAAFDDNKIEALVKALESAAGGATRSRDKDQASGAAVSHRADGDGAAHGLHNIAI